MAPDFNAASDVSSVAASSSTFNKVSDNDATKTLHSTSSLAAQKPQEKINNSPAQVQAEQDFSQQKTTQSEVQGDDDFSSASQSYADYAHNSPSYEQDPYGYEDEAEQSVQRTTARTTKTPAGAHVNEKQSEKPSAKRNESSRVDNSRTQQHSNPSLAPQTLQPSPRSQQKSAIAAQQTPSAVPQATTVTEKAEASTPAVKQLSEAQAVDGFDWYQVFSKLPCQGLLRSVAAHCQFINKSGQHIELRLDETQSALYNDKLCAELETILCAYLNQPVTLEIVKGALDTESPHQRNQRLKREQHAARVDIYRQHSAIQNIMQHFDAQLDEASIDVQKDPAKTGSS